jgi:hypothetical protein
MTNKNSMSKNLHKRLRELQRIAALHQPQAATAIGGVPQTAVIANDGTAVISNTPTATMAIGTPAHYQVIRRDLVFVVILMVIMIGLLLGLDWLVGHTGLAQWIVGLGNAIR